eukprot:278629_1
MSSTKASVELNVHAEKEEKDDQQIVSAIQSKLGDEQSETIKWNGLVDVISAFLLIIIGVITVYFIYSFRETNKKRYCIITGIYFIISATMSILLNNSHISTVKVIVTLFIVYVLFGVVFFVISVIISMSFSAHFGAASFLSSWWILLVLLSYELISKKRKTKKILKYLWSIKALIFPITAHIADISSDLATCYEYYQLAQAGESVVSESDEGQTKYQTIFTVSVFILCFYRFVGALIIWKYTQSIPDAILQFFELFLFKTLSKEWKLKYTETGRLHQTLDLLESVFESGPQAIISIYIIISDVNSSWIIWTSSLISVSMIASKAIKEDKKYFTRRIGAKEFEFRTDKLECNDTRLCYCNWPFLVRYLWRVVDIISFILFCAAYWYFLGGFNIFFWLGAQVIIMIIGIAFMSGSGINSVNISLVNALLVTAPSPFILNAKVLLVTYPVFGFAAARNIINLAMAFNMIAKTFNPITLSILLLFIITTICYWVFIGNFLLNWLYYLILKQLYPNHVKKAPNNNWVNEAITTMNIASCNNMEEIQFLIKEGVNMQQCLRETETWELYPRPHELIQMAKIYNTNLDKFSGERFNYFTQISKNMVLDGNVTMDQVEGTIIFLKEFNELAKYKGRLGHDMYYGARYNPNTIYIKAMIKYGAYYDIKKCLETAKEYNDTSGKCEVISFFQTLFDERERMDVGTKLEIKDWQRPENDRLMEGQVIEIYSGGEYEWNDDMVTVLYEQDGQTHTKEATKYESHLSEFVQFSTFAS